MIDSAPPAPVCHAAPLAGANAAYAAAVAAMAPKAVATFYLPQGRAEQADGSALVGPARIAAYLAGFKGYHVASEAMEIAAITPLAPRRWRIDGRYRQTGTTPGGSRYAVAGGYQADWACHHGHWRLARLATTPDPG